MAAIPELIETLERALEDRERRLESVKRFQESVWSSKDLHPNPEVACLIRDLAYDLELFEPDDRVRAEEPTSYGDTRLEEEIRWVLRKLRS